MSAERCHELARELRVPEDRARELCRDPDLQRCAMFVLPRTASDLNLDNFIACYGRRQTTERKD